MLPAVLVVTSVQTTGIRVVQKKSKNGYFTCSFIQRGACPSGALRCALPPRTGVKSPVTPPNNLILEKYMHYGAIKNFDVANGIGVRVSLFVSGCRNCCKGCFQPQTWDFNYGQEFTEETQQEIIKLMEPSHITGFSLLGGEPFEEENQTVLAPFLEKLKQIYPKKDIWCWTGYILEKDLQSGCPKHTEFTDRMLACIDTLVDGPFIESQRNLMLEFRGSENQRILKLH